MNVAFIHLTGRLGRALFLLLALTTTTAVYAHTQRIINLGLNEAMPLKYTQRVDTVFIANPEVADYQVVKGNQIVIYGKTVGSTSLLLLDEKGSTIDYRTLVINKSLTSIEQQIAARYPESTITLMNLGEQVVLAGAVPSEQMKRDIYYLVGELLGKESTDEKISWVTDDKTHDLRFMTRREFKGVVNNIEVAEVKQVNVKLTVAEVSHSFIRQLGAKWGSFDASGENFLGNGQIFTRTLGSINSSDIARYISAADDDSMGQILAEPNLSVISGETASFLAGGEVPLVTIIDGSQSIEYKEFGVRLEVAADVQRDDKINLAMQPEVSAIDSKSIDVAGNLPTFRTRRARTTIQLGDGESFVLAGLLNNEEREALSKIPLIGDIPIFGSMFRHTTHERQQTELIIVATVNLVKPVPPGSIQLPQMQQKKSLVNFFNIPGQNNIQPTPVENKARLILSAGGFKE